jgi:hypothetical protein
MSVGQAVRVKSHGSDFYGETGKIDAVFMFGFFGVVLDDGKRLSFAGHELKVQPSYHETIKR